MSRPTGRDKAVVFGAPAGLLAAYLVALFSHGAVWAAAFGAYLSIAAALGVWLVRRVRAQDLEIRHDRERSNINERQP